MTKKKPAVATHTQPASSIKFQSPSIIETSYRKIFGQYNLHFTLLGVIAEKFRDEKLTNADFKDVMRELSKNYNHHATYANSTNFQNTYNYIIKSHITYCFSAGDYLCKTIRSNNNFKLLKSNYKEKFSLIDNGDFINKTLTLIFWIKSENQENISTSELLELAKKHKNDTLDFSILDYYRIVRNYELHTPQNGTISLDEAYSRLQLDLINKKYNKIPNKYPNLTSDDALLCALAWIDAGRWLCQNMYNYEKHLIPEIQRRFANLSPSRRHTAAVNFMLQNLLFPHDKVTSTIKRLGW